MKLTRRQLLNLAPHLVAARLAQRVRVRPIDDETQIPMSVPTAVGQEVRYFAFLPMARKGK